MQQKAKRTAQAAKKEKQQIVAYRFPLGKINFMIIAAAIAMIVVGFILIAGGSTADGSFNPEIFNATRLVVGPTLTFIGFIGIGVGIMWGGTKERENQTDAANTNN